MPPNAALLAFIVNAITGSATATVAGMGTIAISYDRHFLDGHVDPLFRCH